VLLLLMLQEVRLRAMLLQMLQFLRMS